MYSVIDNCFGVKIMCKKMIFWLTNIEFLIYKYIEV